MSHIPTIPMSPDQLPQQRLHEVVDLPPRPEGFQGHCAWAGPEPVPLELERATHPRKFLYLCQLEWAWSPMAGRIADFYLNPRRRHWVLWMNSLDDNEVPWRWRWSLYGWARRRAGVSERQAAVHLLLDTFRDEATHMSLDPYHWINHEGALTVADLEAIVRVVWPEEETSHD